MTTSNGSDAEREALKKIITLPMAAVYRIEECGYPGDAEEKAYVASGEADQEYQDMLIDRVLAWHQQSLDTAVLKATQNYRRLWVPKTDLDTAVAKARREQVMQDELSLVVDTDLDEKFLTRWRHQQLREIETEPELKNQGKQESHHE